MAEKAFVDVFTHRRATVRQLEAMERELLLKKSLLHKKVRKKLHHTKTLKEAFNEAAHIQATTILENITAKQCEIDVLETDLLNLHKSTAELRTALLQRVLPVRAIFYRHMC